MTVEAEATPPFMFCQLCGTMHTVCTHIESGFMRLEDEVKRLKEELQVAERRVKDLEYAVRLARATLPEVD